MSDTVNVQIVVFWSEELRAVARVMRDMRATVADEDAPDRRERMSDLIDALIAAASVCFASDLACDEGTALLTTNMPPILRETPRAASIQRRKSGPGSAKGRPEPIGIATPETDQSADPSTPPEPSA